MDLSEILSEAPDATPEQNLEIPIIDTPRLRGTWPAAVPPDQRWVVRVMGVFDREQAIRIALVFIPRVTVGYNVQLQGAGGSRSFHTMGAVRGPRGEIVPGGVTAVPAAEVTLESGENLEEALKHGLE